MSVKYSLIIPSFNTLEFTKRCVESLLPYVTAKSEVILVDDGSTDGTSRYISEVADKNPAVSSVIFEVNQGLSRARNAGIGRAVGDFLFFLDSDTVCHEDVIPPLLRAMEKDKQTGIVGMCGIVMSDFYHQVHVDYADFPESMPVTAVPSYCLMVRRQVIDAGVTFDVNMETAISEDVEFCLHARSKGFGVMAATNIPLEHQGHGSNLEARPEYRNKVIKNLDYIRKKWSDKIKLPLPEDENTLSRILSRPGYSVIQTEKMGDYTFADAQRAI